MGLASFVIHVYSVGWDLFSSISALGFLLKAFLAHSFTPLMYFNLFLVILILYRYGFYGDVIMESEKYRWMGPKRYDYAGTKVFLQHRYVLVGRLPQADAYVCLVIELNLAF